VLILIPSLGETGTQQFLLSAGTSQWVGFLVLLTREGSERRRLVIEQLENTPELHNLDGVADFLRQVQQLYVAAFAAGGKCPVTPP
jgi:hypothetical protein